MHDYCDLCGEYGPLIVSDVVDENGNQLFVCYETEDCEERQFWKKD